MEWVAVLSRWVHVGTAIVLVGGAVFKRYVLIPAAANLPEATRDDLRRRIVGTWKKFVMAGIALFLLTGFYNYLVISIPEHKGDGLYHGLMGTKIILSFVVFFLASALTGRSAALENFRRNPKRWLGALILLSAVIVGIAGYLKVDPLERHGPRPIAGGEAPAETR
ncbi:MAG: hypothetical protein WD069_01750 [Planctomycetales bacterium]